MDDDNPMAFEQSVERIECDGCGILFDRWMLTDIEEKRPFGNYVIKHYCDECK